jgi:NADPH:quinone reductase-like Zn-dependent oxidoreductase
MKNQNMKAWRLGAFGIDHLKLDEVNVPAPGPNDLLIRVGAVSLNFRDKALIDGYYDPNALANGPLIPVSDAAGAVVATGENVTRFAVGDRVTTHFHSKWLDGVRKPDEGAFTYGGPLPGGLAEYMILHEDGAVATPGYLSDEEAATLPIAALTAWFALNNAGNIQKGDTILIQGTGGVSIFAIQIARAMGVNTIVTTSTDEKAEKAKSLGATHVINYNTFPDWENEVLRLTDNRGVDEVLEVVGGDISKSVASLKINGLIAVIGFLAGPELKMNMFPVLGKQLRLQGIATGHRKAFEQMLTFFGQHQIKPVVGEVYPFENAPEALRSIEKGGFGKIVIKNL